MIDGVINRRHPRDIVTHQCGHHSVHIGRVLSGYRNPAGLGVGRKGPSPSPAMRPSTIEMMLLRGSLLRNKEGDSDPESSARPSRSLANFRPISNRPSRSGTRAIMQPRIIVPAFRAGSERVAVACPELIVGQVVQIPHSITFIVAISSFFARA